MWRLGRVVGGTRAAAATALLFAVVPFSVYYTTEARMYSLLWMLLAAFVLLSLRLRSRGATVGSVAGWSLCGAGALLTHYFSAPVWAALVVWLAVWPGRLERRWLALGVLATVALIAPWYVNLPASLAGWRVTGGWLRIRPERFHRVVDALRLPWRPFTTHGPWGGRMPIEAAAAAVLVLVLVLSRGRPGRGWLSARWAVWWLPVLAMGLGLLLFDALRGTYTVAVPRYMAAALPSAYVLAGALVARVGRRPRAVLVAGLLATSAVVVSWMNLATSRVTQPYDRVARTLAAEMDSGDVAVVHSIPGGVCGVARALVGAGAPEVELLPWSQALGLREIPGDVDRWLSGRSRVFLVSIHTVGERAPVADELRARRGDARVVVLDRGARIFVFGPERDGGAVAARGTR
jgi:hypothetical protein